MSKFLIAGAIVVGLVFLLTGLVLAGLISSPFGPTKARPKAVVVTGAPVVATNAPATYAGSPTTDDDELDRNTYVQAKSAGKAMGKFRF